MIKIKIKEHVIDLYKNDYDSPIYSIRKDELFHTRKEDGHIISDWIDHLMSKTWMEYNTLYELAVLIQKEFPENKIDWSVTFFPLEKGQYLDHIKKTRNIISNNNPSKKGVDDLFEDLEIGIEEQNDDVNNKVAEIVDKNLLKYGLI